MVQTRHGSYGCTAGAPLATPCHSAAAPVLGTLLRRAAQFRLASKVSPSHSICLYPILDRPDWDDSTHWHNSGLWDLMPDASGTLRRVLDYPYAEAQCYAQASSFRDPRVTPPRYATVGGGEASSNPPHA